MVSGKYSALAGAVSRDQSLSNLANNLANINTTGFKKMQVSFEAILRGEQQITDASGINYNRIRHNYSDFSAGPLKETGNPFDLALQGTGFFKVQGPDGPLLTRNGAFTVDQDGMLRTLNGYPVLDLGNAPIELGQAVNGGKITVNSYGTVFLTDQQGISEELAQIGVFDVAEPAKLQRRENAAFAMENGVADQPVENPVIVSGTLESSNVNMAEEMANMVNNHRLYEIYLKAIKAYSTISEKQEELGKLS